MTPFPNLVQLVVAIHNALHQARVLPLGVSAHVSQLLLAFWTPLGGPVACAPTTTTRQAKDVQVEHICC